MPRARPGRFRRAAPRYVPGVPAGLRDHRHAKWCDRTPRHAGGNAARFRLGQRILSLAQLPNLRVPKQRASGSSRGSSRGSSSSASEWGIVEFGQPCEPMRRHNCDRWVTRGVDLWGVDLCSVYERSLAPAAETVHACTVTCRVSRLSKQRPYQWKRGPRRQTSPPAHADFVKGKFTATRPDRL